MIHNNAQQQSAQNQQFANGVMGTDENRKLRTKKKSHSNRHWNGIIVSNGRRVACVKLCVLSARFEPDSEPATNQHGPYPIVGSFDSATNKGAGSLPV
jgi:hypothetical protein